MAGKEPRERRGQWNREARTRLAAERMKRRISQRQLADRTGLALSSYRKLERGELPLAPLAWWVNCALALGLELTEVLDEEQLRWTPFDLSLAAEAPERDWWQATYHHPRDPS